MIRPYKQPSNLKFFPFLILGVLAVAIIVVVLVTFIKPPYSFNTPEETWTSYIRSINEKNIGMYANVFFDKDTSPYQAVLDDQVLIDEMMAMQNVSTINFNYNTQLSYDWNSNRVVDAKIYYEIGDTPMSRDLRVIFRFLNGRWYIYLPD